MPRKHTKLKKLRPRVLKTLPRLQSQSILLDSSDDYLTETEIEFPEEVMATSDLFEESRRVDMEAGAPNCG
jgi:hypothetical protein